MVVQISYSIYCKTPFFQTYEVEVRLLWMPMYYYHICKLIFRIFSPKYRKLSLLRESGKGYLTVIHEG